MKLVFTFCFLFIGLCPNAQVRGEISLGALQSLGRDKAELISSSTQAVGVFTSTSRRYNTLGLRGRGVLSKSITNRISASVQSGFNLRRNEELWGRRYDYISVPIQGGGSYKILKNNLSVLSISAFSGINVFTIKNQYGKQSSGFIHDGELNYLFMTRGFFKSIIVKAGYEFQIDNETYYYRSTDPFFKDEDINYKVRRNQIYFAVGLGL